MAEHELYAQHSSATFEVELSKRIASQAAGFLLPHLRPGMNVLDAGCGPGSITVGLAAVVAPGEVVGIDIQLSQVEQARTFAAQRGVTNVRFEASNIYELPFPDGSFDVAFANSVLEHLREPVRALAELRRVLRPSGIAGIRDRDSGGFLMAPVTPLLQEGLSLRERVRQHHGADFTVGRHHRRLLLEAGFMRAEASASIDCAGSPEKTRQFAAYLKAQFPAYARIALVEGWTDQATLDAILAEIDAWGERPDAFQAAPRCEAIGWVSE
ncbi:MAG TPA: methyltransferase domain-containing protein [Candidatus Binatia bacterium]|nr:methyltransferase domain-containing protein [Candidatus Binatia bacterium]